MKKPAVSRRLALAFGVNVALLALLLVTSAKTAKAAGESITEFVIACNGGNSAQALRILERNPTWATDKKNGPDVMKEASDSKLWTIVSYLLDKGADPGPAIYGAAANGQEKLVKTLVEKGADPDWGMAEAASNNKLPIIKFLVEKGAKPDSGMAGAANNGSLEMIKFLVGKGAKPDNAVEIAAAKNQKEMLDYLLAKGASPQKALKGAAPNGHMELIKQLLANGAMANDPEVLKDTAYRLQLNVLKLLAANGADLRTNATDLFANALQGRHTWYAEQGSQFTALLEFINGFGPDVNYASKGGTTLLMSAISNVTAMEFLLKNGAKIDTRDSEGRTALHYAVTNSKDSAATVKLLLSKGASPNAQDKHGQTPLYKIGTLVNCDVEVAKALVEGGASLDIKDERGRTPLNAIVITKFPVDKNVKLYLANQLSPNESRLQGVVRVVDTTQKTITIEALSVTLSSGKTNLLTPPRTRTLSFDDDTTILLAGDHQILEEIKVGASVAVAGKGDGSDHAFSARVITVSPPLPAPGTVALK